MKTAILSLIIGLALQKVSHAQDASFIKEDLQSVTKQEKELKAEKKEDKITLRKLRGAEVSNLSREAFFRDFGNIPVAWDREDYFDVATFQQDDQTVKAYYDYDSQLVGTVTEKQFSDLPADAQQYINKKYGGYTAAQVSFFEDNKYNETDMIFYGKQFEDADNYFVLLEKPDRKIILQVTPEGYVDFFTDLK